MIKFTVYVDKDMQFCGFKSEGHAGGEDKGQNIVCAGVSTAVFGTYYFIKYSTNAKIRATIKDAEMKLMLKEPHHDALVALKMLMQQIEMVRSQTTGDSEIEIRIKGVK